MKLISALLFALIEGLVALVKPTINEPFSDRRRAPLRLQFQERRERYAQENAMQKREREKREREREGKRVLTEFFSKVPIVRRRNQVPVDLIYYSLHFLSNAPQTLWQDEFFFANCLFIQDSVTILALLLEMKQRTFSPKVNMLEFLGAIEKFFLNFVGPNVYLSLYYHLGYDTMALQFSFE